MSRRNPYVVRKSKWTAPPPQQLDKEDIKNAIDIAVVNGWVQERLPRKKLIGVHVLALGPQYSGDSTNPARRCFQNSYLYFSNSNLRQVDLSQSSFYLSIAAHQMRIFVIKYSDYDPNSWIIRVFANNSSSSVQIYPIQQLFYANSRIYIPRAFYTTEQYPWSIENWNTSGADTDQATGLSFVARAVYDNPSDIDGDIAHVFSGYQEYGVIGSTGPTGLVGSTSSRNSLFLTNMARSDTGSFSYCEIIQPIDADLHIIS